MKVLPDELLSEILPENADVTDFKLDPTATRKMVDILATQLYENPRISCLRELYFNAVEANLSVGKSPDQVICKFENDMLIVRDQGPGLDEEMIRKTYCEFFWSSKDESNEYIGGFGLGAKSPLSVTNHFFVTSYHNGVKTRYKIFIGSDNTIEYEKLNQSSTDETGIMVEVPMELGHWYYDLERALKLFKAQVCGIKKGVLVHISDKYWDAYLIASSMFNGRYTFLGTSFTRYLKQSNPAAYHSFIVFKPGYPYLKPTASRESCVITDQEAHDNTIEQILDKLHDKFYELYGLKLNDECRTVGHLNQTKTISHIFEYDYHKKIAIYVTKDEQQKVIRRKNTSIPKSCSIIVPESKMDRFKRILDTAEIKHEIYYVGKPKKSTRKASKQRYRTWKSIEKLAADIPPMKLDKPTSISYENFSCYTSNGYYTICLLARTKETEDMARKIHNAYYGYDSELMDIHSNGSKLRKVGRAIAKFILDKLAITDFKKLGNHERKALALFAMNDDEIFHPYYYEAKLGLTRDEFVQLLLQRYQQPKEVESE